MYITNLITYCLVLSMILSLAESFPHYFFISFHIYYYHFNKQCIYK